MIELRPYQKIAVDKGLNFLRSDAKEFPIIVAPTAAGKSIYIAKIAHKLGGGVLVLQPSKELLEQNYAKFKMYGGEASIFSASMGVKEIGDITFATIGSVKNCAHLFKHIKYVMIDECHLVPPKEDSMYVSFLCEFETIKVLGFTATPFRLKSYMDPFDGSNYSQINLLPRERPRMFNTFLHVTQISELYEGGFLTPIEYDVLPWETKDLKVNTTGAEWTELSMERAILQQKVNQRIPEIIAQSIADGYKHRIVFVHTVDLAIVTSAKVPNSAVVHAETPKKERAQILADFKAGKITTVFNVNILTIGFDFPELDMIIIARPTMSLALFMQMIGRGIRLAPGKEKCKVVDMCGNVDRFSRIEQIKYETDPQGRWVITNGEKVLSGVKLAS